MRKGSPLHPVTGSKRPKLTFEQAGTMSKEPLPGQVGLLNLSADSAPSEFYAVAGTLMSGGQVSDRLCTEKGSVFNVS
jgi:hypothetical protein